ncbi:cellulose synthase complex periplasmic endoglucanase BcsZ [Pigmentiphaga sp. GD03639]|uniref:cellulase n=1 Tax=Pigmentiphaga daeguensis TaxID=414049 RepID=A0ABP3M1I3_9BURK|nr:cellulose synthase complex periplasmic endoglucanase BcsZ [Pigmentiphaga sp. GD03639]MDH2236039.1 cellulose synthase complex periplasmic endoglucanase BcsZ [Pigmentiphaga sp. GD03639]
MKTHPAIGRLPWRLAAMASALSFALAGPAAVRAAAGPDACTPAWPLWQAFGTHFIQPDGRVLDASTPRLHSSSEGQSYGMFFALVANDAAAFDRMWRWAVDNLAGGDIGARLPAWYWGKREDGTWGVLDDNSASDADLWFAYALFEAGERWRRDDYLRDARALVARIEAEETVELPGLGPMLLPGRSSFARPDSLWQINPSYLPLPLLRRLATVSPSGPWARIADNTAALLAAVSPKGYVADWVAYRGASPASGLFVVDPTKGDLGSYDAIRTYLWAGMAPTSDPLADPMLQALRGMAASTASAGTPPERVRAMTGQTEGTGPFGFSSALVPYFTAKKQPWLADLQRRRAQALLDESLRTAGPGRQPPYYDVVLSLFGLGWAEERYRFLSTGQVQLSWEKTCPPTVAR